MARPKFAVGTPGVRSLIITLAGVVAAAYEALTYKVIMPASGKVVGVTYNAGAKGGTFSTAALDVQDDGVSILGTTIDVAAAVAGTPVSKEGTALAAGAATVAKDSVLSIVQTVSGGSSPTHSGATLQIDYVPTGD